MTHLGYLIAGWGFSSLVILIYAFRLLNRGARLSARVPDQNARWMSCSESERGFLTVK